MWDFLTPGQPLNNFTATAAPTATDDSSKGYSVGSWWFNNTTNLLRECVDATVSAAVWVGVQANDHPGYVSGRYYPTFEAGATTGSAVQAIDLLYVYPFFVRAKVAITKFGIRVITGGAASALKGGIYANKTASGSGQYGPVGAPLGVDNTGIATTGNNTGPELSISLTLSPGVYWAAQKYTGTLPTAVSILNTAFSTCALMGRTSLGNNAAVVCKSLSDTYSNDLPTLSGSESWTDVVTSGTPILHLKVA